MVLRVIVSRESRRTWLTLIQQEKSSILRSNTYARMQRRERRGERERQTAGERWGRRKGRQTKSEFDETRNCSVMHYDHLSGRHARKKIEHERIMTRMTEHAHTHSLSQRIKQRIAYSYEGHGGCELRGHYPLCKKMLPAPVKKLCALSDRRVSQGSYLATRL